MMQLRDINYSMYSDLFELLELLLTTPSPTGSEQAVQRLIYDHFASTAHSITPDVQGNLILSLNPEAKTKIMLAAHCDQIGFIIKYVDANGFLFLESLGGTDSGVLPREHLEIHTKSGKITGIVGRKPLHLQSGGEVQQIPKKDHIWVDIGARGHDQALTMVQIGNTATFPARVTRLGDDLISSPGLDNKAGLAVCLDVFRKCSDLKSDVGLYVVSTTQEEIGSRGATIATRTISPDIGIAVDVVPSTDDPGYDLPPQRHVPCSLGGGPSLSMGPNTNPILGQLLLKAASANSIPHQVDPCGSTAANDSRVIQIEDSGVAAASVGIPQRYMHTQVEVVSVSDLHHTIDLLTQFVRQYDPSTDLRPFFGHHDGATLSVH